MTVKLRLIYLKNAALFGVDGIGIDEFCKIAEKEEEISEKALIRAFKVIDVNNDGFISFSELYNVLTRVSFYFRK